MMWILKTRVNIMAFVGSKSAGRALHVWLAAIGIALAAGCATVPKARVSLADLPPAQVARAEENLRVFNAAWDFVNRKHYDPKLQGVDWEAAAATYAPQAAAAADEKALYAVLNTMVGSLHDSHTHALTPVQSPERKTHEPAQTGFNMARIENHWIVTEVLPQSPAEQVGIKPGWIVAALNAVPVGPRLDFRPRE